MEIHVQLSVQVQFLETLSLDTSVVHTEKLDGYISLQKKFHLALFTILKCCNW